MRLDARLNVPLAGRDARLFDAPLRADRLSARGRFRLAVDRSFSLPGVGAVVTGTVLSGSVNVDDRVTISPRGIVARVRSIHAQNRMTTTGRSGERCALNLAGEGAPIVKGQRVRC